MGLVHIYCGDGKGKTTSATGLAVRSAGAGMTVFFARLMKGTYSSELKILEQIPEFTVISCDRNYGFSFRMSEKDKAEITKCHNRMISEAFSSDCDLIVLDEFFSAYNYNLIDRELAISLIKNKNPDTELVLTGRNPSDEFLELADYISSIDCIKHPYNLGIKARKGIEY